MHLFLGFLMFVQFVHWHELLILCVFFCISLLNTYILYIHPFTSPFLELQINWVKLSYSEYKL